MSRLPPRPTAARTPRKGPRGLAGVPGSAGRRGEGEEAVPARPPRPPFPGEAQASGRREAVRGAGPPGWGSPLGASSPLETSVPRWAPLPPPRGAGRGPGASGVHAPAIGRGRRRPVHGAGPRPGRSEPWAARRGPASGALTPVVSCAFPTRPGCAALQTPVRKMSCIASAARSPVRPGLCARRRGPITARGVQALSPSELLGPADHPLLPPVAPGDALGIGETPLPTFRTQSSGGLGQ